MQTVLGAGGSIGTSLAESLRSYTENVRLVSRNPNKVNEDDELFIADLTKADEVKQAVKGSDVAYLTAGIPYKASVWEKFWPVIMKNAIEACREADCRLVFFDNMYMYHPKELPHMTEKAIVDPVSRKGKVRQQIADMLLESHARGEVKALIARSADFYGPGIRNSVLQIAVLENLIKGKKANWFCSTKYKHSFTYTPDAGKATAILGNDEKAYGEVWHMPTAGNPPTGEEIIKMMSDELGVTPKVQVAGRMFTSILGIFIPYMKEFVEMLYQWDDDYVFDSSKFEKAYGFKPTPYKVGVKEVVEVAKRKFNK